MCQRMLRMSRHITSSINDAMATSWYHHDLVIDSIFIIVTIVINIRITITIIMSIVVITIINVVFSGSSSLSKAD